MEQSRSKNNTSSLVTMASTNSLPIVLSTFEKNRILKHMPSVQQLAPEQHSGSVNLACT